MKPYDYSDIKLTCPFCKSEMEFDTVLVDHEYNMPYYIIYCCSNGACQFELELYFDEFDDRLPNDDPRKEDNITTDAEGRRVKLHDEGPEYLDDVEEKKKEK